MSNVIAKGISSTLKTAEKEAVRANIDAPSNTEMTAVEGRATALEGRATALEDSEFGVGQALQAFTVGTERSINTPYTNLTGKPIQISVSVSGQNCNCNITVSSVVAFDSNVNGPSGSLSSVCGVATVPDGETYIVSNTQGTLTRWSELR